MNSLFGKKLVEHRKRLGLSSIELANLCGVSRSYITLIETGKRLPGTKILPKIATGLQIKTSVVLNWYLEEISQKIKNKLEAS
ncbi:MAG TPA: helix-turn-helix transcriptional regulator [Candidatus Sulfotelmatobacter sp.]|jgi:transcriptional regulator with XRE-family HTH domain|nr:helix-turn-helix transcriptional regulator [Candidatus Sulfotelmatobacter sp.]